MIYMLMGGVEEAGGNSTTLSDELKIENEIGAKTGTSNDASDGWYVGITRDLFLVRGWEAMNGVFTIGNGLWDKAAEQPDLYGKNTC